MTYKPTNAPYKTGDMTTMIIPIQQLQQLHDIVSTVMIPYAVSRPLIDRIEAAINSHGKTTRGGSVDRPSATLGETRGQPTGRQAGED